MKYCPETNTFIVQEGASAEGIIPHVMWHITDVCPLACPYCFAAKTEAGLPLEFIDSIADALLTLGVQKVDISGGEPLAYEFLEEACGALWSRGIYTTVTTSGVGKKRNKEFIVRNAARFSRLIFSLDGYGEDHDKIRRKKGAWQDAIDLVSMIDPGIRKKSCRVNTVLTRVYYENSWGKKLAPAVDLLGVKEWCLIQPHPANQKTEYSDYSLDMESFLVAVEEGRKMASNVEVITRDNDMYSTYWNIQPSGILQQHTRGSSDDKAISLILNHPAAIKSATKKTFTIVPT